MTPIIPTPHLLEKGSGRKTFDRERVHTVRLLGEPSDRLTFAGEFLRKNLEERFGLHCRLLHDDAGAADFLICTDQRALEGGCLTEADLSHFTSEAAREQGYVLKSVAGEPALLFAQTEVGCLYAVATLLQALRKENDVWVLDDVVIRDYPDFLYRGNKWVLWCELGIWSYDRGDGLGAYLRRIIRKLDMALLYKVNMIIFDGWGWGVDPYPEYPALMRELNRQARLRGIHLMFTGQCSGHAKANTRPDLVRGHIYENRRGYPDGDSYDCIGGERFHGTCLSNEPLMEMRLADLRRFVAEVQPGALYVHQLDLLNLPSDAWTARCPGCRRAWPSDRLDASDGMAGAFARFYDEMVSCVQSVKTPEYDAERDCLIMLVSPGYMDAVAQDDNDWGAALTYWASLSRLMGHRENVFFGFREQFYNHTRATRRVPEMKENLQSRGAGHRLSLITFSGGDGWQNEQLFLPIPQLIPMYLGADMLLCACGHAYQEPLQLFNAEFMWNATGSPYTVPGGLPGDFAGFKALHDQCRAGNFRTPQVFGEGGFLEIACGKLYGEEGARAMAQLFSTRGAKGEPPVCFLKNKELLTSPRPEGTLQKVLGWDSETSADEVSRARATYEELLRVTNDAAQLLSRETAEDLSWFRESLLTASQYLGLLLDYVAIYQGLSALGGAASRQMDARMAALGDEVRAMRLREQKSRLQPVDYLKGALSGRDIILAFLENNLSRMREASGGTTHG